MAENGNNAITLREFNNRIKRLLNNPAVCNCWICADLSDVNVRGGHCYLELLEKDERTGATVAKMRGIIWANRFAYLRQKFVQVTGQDLRSGLKVMLEVSVNYHEQYGISLIITDIDPSYTLGDMERLRREILTRLKAEGIIDMNKQLEFPVVPQRIAIVSAAGAAGYGDFMNQLHNNAYGLQFYTCLFPAVMQGKETVASVTAALDRINRHIDLFDCVVIIRGGGSTSDLNSFDDYNLAANVAQFPLPVLTGIGHERDETVIDLVACQRLKTPTAVAAWLISLRQNEAAALTALTQRLQAATRECLYNAQQRLQQRALALQRAAHTATASRHAKVQRMDAALTCRARLAHEAERTERTAEALAHAAQTLIAQQRTALAAASRCIAMAGPERILRMGFAIVRKDGHVLTDATQATGGDRLDITLDRGTLSATVE